MLQGEIISLHTKLRIGYLRGEDNMEYVFQAQSVKGVPFEMLDVGQSVRFKPDTMVQSRASVVQPSL